MISHIRDDIMGMPITVCVVESRARQKDIDAVFAYFQNIDNTFSTYKKDSEISKFNRGEMQKKDLSKDVQEVLMLSEKTKQQTNGYFDIQKKDGTIDPSGLVKGWAIWQAVGILKEKGFNNFYIEAGGDIQAMGKNQQGKQWKVGIKNPFEKSEIVKVLHLLDKGVATSGTYERGAHVYNPHNIRLALKNIVSFTVIGPTVYEADRYATACFAMQEKGILFLEKQSGLEGYMIDRKGTATMTSGFETYVGNN